MTITSTASCTYTSLSRAAHCSNENCTKKFCLFCIDLFCGIECAIDKFMDGKLAIIKAFYIIVANIIRHCIVFLIANFCPDMKCWIHAVRNKIVEKFCT